MTNFYREELGIVVIGRNEGERLKKCLSSLPEGIPIVYVDSGSTDGSAKWARDFGAEVVELDTEIPFTAARARNEGFRQLKKAFPQPEYVQFIDGDCELHPVWPENAIAFLSERKQACAAFGRRRERYPHRSIYNRLCDLEWNVPLGDVASFGGDVMIRGRVFEAVGGYRSDLIAGEESELCVRLRALGWHIFRIDFEMTLHDAAMDRFSQWWRRQVRAGYAYAQGADIHGAEPEHHWVWESHRALFWGAWLPLICAVTTIVFGYWGAVAWLIYPAQITRQIIRTKGQLYERVVIAFSQMLSRFPESIGQARFAADKIRGRYSSIIEYK